MDIFAHTLKLRASLMVWLCSGASGFHRFHDWAISVSVSAVFMWVVHFATARASGGLLMPLQGLLLHHALSLSDCLHCGPGVLAEEEVLGR